MSVTEIGNQHEVEEALERILQLQKQHMNQIAYSDNILPDPSAEHSPDHYSYDVYPSSVGSSSSQSNFEQCLMHGKFVFFNCILNSVFCKSINQS